MLWDKLLRLFWLGITARQEHSLNRSELLTMPHAPRTLQTSQISGGHELGGFLLSDLRYIVPLFLHSVVSALCLFLGSGMPSQSVPHDEVQNNIAGGCPHGDDVMQRLILPV